MSRNTTFVGARRVIRGGTAARVSSLSFPTIIDLPAPTPDVPAPDTDISTATIEIEPVPVPVVDPAVLEEARAEAAAHGYADGFAAGHADAVAATRVEAAALLARLDEAVRSFQDRQQQSFDELTDDVARFAIATVEAMLGYELAVTENPTRDAICRALRIAPARADTTVVVHPDDLPLLGTVDDLGGARRLELVTDASIERGGCIVRAADCEVDAQLSGALDRLRSALEVPSHVMGKDAAS